MPVYNINGLDVSQSGDIQLDYAFDETSNANYTILRINKLKIDGSYQYPFVYCPNGTSPSTKSTLDFNMEKKFPVAINAGYFNISNNTPIGVVIQNGVAIKNGTEPQYYHRALTIDASGNLGVTLETNAQTLVSDGIISAVLGYPLLIDNYESTGATSQGENAQRQIIGQFGNEDYAIITCEGRNYDHSDGWTWEEATDICQKIGLKFAYALDGGGSVETCVRKKQINTIYERTTGRIVPTYIVFNGTNHFIA